MAKGFTQEYGQDYEETFSPVAKMTTVRLLVAIAAARHWPLYQYQKDVKKAFLHGDLSSSVYMQPPPGSPFSDQYNSNLVCRLKKAIYGFQKAPRSWFEKLSSALLTLDSSSSDHSLFVKRSKDQGQSYLYMLTTLSSLVMIVLVFSR